MENHSDDVKVTSDLSDQNQASQDHEQEEGQDTFQIFVQPREENKEKLSLQVSPQDNIQDIKQYLFEAIETCYHTNYHLYLNDEKLNDFADLSDTPITVNSVLEMRDAPYDERALRLHIRRLREIINTTPPNVSPSQFFKICKDTESDSGITTEEVIKVEPAQLSSFYRPGKSSRIDCLKRFCISGWNPPPSNRRLMGDLLYFEVTTLENRSFHITGAVQGFFINSSTTNNFNPTSSSDKTFHVLYDLFKEISPGFTKNIESILELGAQKHPFESYPLPLPITPWVGRKEKHNYDLSRAEDFLVYSADLELRGQSRDWNEEYQTCRSLPATTIQERIIRDRAILKVNWDFLEASVRGAKAIAEKTILPINPLDPEKAHMYIYNNIFFSYAIDGRDFYKEYGGDRAAYAAVNNDLKGIRAFNRADIEGLCTLATAVIDYRGFRLVAQSIIPGILQREQTSTVVYGSTDNGKTVNSDPEFHDLLCKAGKKLFIKEHTVLDEKGEKVKLCCPIEAKGIVGTDGRKYLLDLIRVTPRDTNYQGKTHALTILREELLGHYNDHLLLEKKKAQEKEQKSTTTSKKEEEIKEEENEIEILLPSLNPNVFCDFKFGDSEEEIKKDQDEVNNLSQFLKNNVIPSLIEDFSWIINIPLDGSALTQLMHSRGINMRYLGILAKSSIKIQSVIDLCLREMLTRAAKHIFREILRETLELNLASVISHFLNCFLAKNNFGTKNKNNQKKGKNINFSRDVFSMTPLSLWERITLEVADRFQYELPPRENLKDIIASNITLRSLCLKVGIQVNSKDYNYSLDSPFQPEDIYDIFPVVKHIEPESADGKNLLEAGKRFLSQGRLDVAYELLTEALAIFHQVYGPMHRDTANCYENLAMVLLQAKDINNALDHQQKAVIINERVLGLDHPETSQSYASFALYCHSQKKHQVALEAIKHTLYLEKIMSGLNHPEVATTFTNLALMYQETKHHKIALEYFIEACKCYEEILGVAHLQTAAMYHAIALAYANLEQFKDALNYEKKNYNILKQLSMPDLDLRVMESNLYLKQFTSKAVQMQIESKKSQRNITSQLTETKLEQLKSSNIQQVNSSLPSINNNTFPQMGERPLTEIMKFIDGNEKPASTLLEIKQKTKSTPSKTISNGVLRQAKNTKKKR